MASIKSRNLYHEIWDRIEDIFNRDISDKTRLAASILFLTIVAISTLSYIGYSAHKIQTLSKTKGAESLELSILRQTVASFKKNSERDKELLQNLNGRIDRIINGEEEGPGTSILELQNLSTPSAYTPPPPSTSYYSQTGSTQATPTPSTSAIGLLETYDPSGKPIFIYKEPTTVSAQSTIGNGENVSYFKKQTDWYLIQIQSGSDNFWWIHVKNVRIIK